MKKALVISYYWPPSGGAGVQRWLKFVKYLRGFNWEPVLFCPANPEYPETDNSLFSDVPANLEVIKLPIWEPYSAYKKLLGQKKEDKISAAFLSEKKKNKTLEGISVWIRGNLFIPDARKFWIKPAAKYLRNYLETHPADVIISTGPPHTTHLIAMSVAASTGIPWLADFRDPWTNIDFYRDLRLSGWADRRHHKLEREVLQKADAVCVISNSMAEDFNRICPRAYNVITNGFDHGDTGNLNQATADTKFSLAHIGTLAGNRNPVTIWKALQNLLADYPALANDLEIKLVGKVDHTVISSLNESGLGSFVRKIDYMPHDQVVMCQQQSQVLMLIINNTPNSKMILTGKFFEYLAARRPILCLGPADGDAAAILNETQAGLLAGFDDVETMQKHILQYYNLFRQGNLVVDSRNIEKYSRKKLTGELAKLLDKLTDKKGV